MEERLSNTELSALLDHYGDDVTIVGETSKQFTVQMSILHQYYDKPKDVDAEWQKIQLIEAAASLIKREIKEVTTNMVIYYSKTLCIAYLLCYICY